MMEPCGLQDAHAAHHYMASDSNGYWCEGVAVSTDAEHGAQGIDPAAVMAAHEPLPSDMQRGMVWCPTCHTRDLEPCEPYRLAEALAAVYQNEAKLLDRAERAERELAERNNESPTLAGRAFERRHEARTRVEIQSLQDERDRWRSRCAGLITLEMKAKRERDAERTAHEGALVMLVDRSTELAEVTCERDGAQAKLRVVEDLSIDGAFVATARLRAALADPEVRP